MKSYEIYDEENSCQLGVLLYFEKIKKAIIELDDNLNEWSSPLLFTSFVKEKVFTIPTDISMLFIRERIIPSGRQNIQSILSNHGLKEYDEIKFLELSEGRCSQDSLCIRKINELPQYVSDRQLHNVKEVAPLSNSSLLCVFFNDTIKLVSLETLSAAVSDVNKVLFNKPLYESVDLVAGGYGISFGDSIEVPAASLYKAGIEIPLSASDLMTFFNRNILDTSDCCNYLECSRQNISYFTKDNRLTPIKNDAKGNLYFRGQVESLRW